MEEESRPSPIIKPELRKKETRALFRRWSATAAVVLSVCDRLVAGYITQEKASRVYVEFHVKNIWTFCKYHTIKYTAFAPVLKQGLNIHIHKKKKERRERNIDQNYGKQNYIY